MKFVLDTNVFVDAFRDEAFADTLSACADEPGASSCEPMYGPLFPAAAVKSVPYFTARWFRA